MKCVQTSVFLVGRGSICFHGLRLFAKVAGLSIQHFDTALEQGEPSGQTLAKYVGIPECMIWVLHNVPKNTGYELGVPFHTLFESRDCIVGQHSPEVLDLVSRLANVLDFEAGAVTIVVQLTCQQMKDIQHPIMELVRGTYARLYPDNR